MPCPGLEGQGPMTVMTAQRPLPLALAEASPVSAAAAMVEDADGGRVFIHGELCGAWGAGDELARRLAATQLVKIKAATARQVAAAFGVHPATLWRWVATRSNNAADVTQILTPCPEA
ncbi:MAG: hypothetical protein GEU78_07775 [Actinobacteria bacterium]|nr:hypothetical protein [Actinomycetota bacterium]MQB00177.1 hypothetical protein [Actinomycetota bacterium]